MDFFIISEKLLNDLLIFRGILIITIGCGVCIIIERVYKSLATGTEPATTTTC
ncbi:unnamed protein product [Meloidogyne enterolobii]|uniref:Uncharacterized protein n=1 Tax=Meloidogyne enterolobii TaxID=390850 RepID=A0ACB1B7Q5_MELEN